jgi:redox-regulated HSP33 family molecular chaperone
VPQLSELLRALPVMQAESEQTNSALALGVCIGRDLRVKSAGGYLVQVGACIESKLLSHCSLLKCQLPCVLVHTADLGYV